MASVPRWISAQIWAPSPFSSRLRELQSHSTADTRSWLHRCSSEDWLPSSPIA